MGWILFVLCVSINIGSSLSEEFPKIHDVFNFDSEITSNTSLPPSLKVEDLNFDMDKIDLDKFRKKILAKGNRMWSNNSTLQAKNRKPIDTRRFKIEWDGYDWNWNDLSQHVTKVKIVDLMLQLIYMSKHNLRQFEADKSFNKTDTGYRMGFLYKRLIYLSRKIINTYLWYRKHVIEKKPGHDLYSDYRWKWAGAMVDQHQIFIRLYEDFSYLWGVMLNIDYKYREKFGIAKYTPANFDKATYKPFFVDRNYEDMERYMHLFHEK